MDFILSFLFYIYRCCCCCCCWLYSLKIIFIFETGLKNMYFVFFHSIIIIILRQQHRIKNIWIKVNVFSFYLFIYYYFVSFRRALIIFVVVGKIMTLVNDLTWFFSSSIFFYFKKLLINKKNSNNRERTKKKLNRLRTRRVFNAFFFYFLFLFPFLNFYFFETKFNNSYICIVNVSGFSKYICTYFLIFPKNLY